MNANSIKEYILDNNYIEELLEAIGCHSIRNHGEYYTAANKDGDNRSAIVVYTNDNINVVNYTRAMSKVKRSTDIFDLICYANECTFPEAVKFVCNFLGLNVYDEEEDVPDSLQLLAMLREMSISESADKDMPLRPIDESVLNDYLPYGNQMFVDSGIDLCTQDSFCIGYDPKSNYITIPIIDAFGALVGVKGRYFGEPDEYHPKYIYLEKCNKSKVLYGFYQNRGTLAHSTDVLVFEAEKSVLECASQGLYNAVSVGGKSISKSQAEMLIRLNCRIILALDQDVTEEELQSIISVFPEQISVSAIIDKEHLLNEKEAPCDNKEVFKTLLNNHIYKLR